MNCPSCNSPSADGKKYCADCGARLDADGERFETLVKTKVEDFIREKFRDQRILEVETSQAVAERVHGWAKMFGFFVGLPIAALLLLLAFAGIEKYSDFTKMIDKAQEQVKTKIDQTRSDVEQAQGKASDAKAKAEEALRTTDTVTAQVNRQLGSATELTKNVQALSTRVANLEKQASEQMHASTQRVEVRVSELDQKIDAATRDIAEQQKKLASTDELVKALFSKGTTEYFQTTTTAPNVAIMPVANGALVFMLLKSVPIYQTIELKWRVFSQPRGSYYTQNNVLIFHWGESADNLKQNPLEVTYVPDPTQKAPGFKTLTVKGKSVFADNTKMLDLGQ